ncbi:LOW QUALITY PROTEIN: hypothetical protein U9M48_027442 [Paspalum notatum var. saurae]|uniref:Reverse transcriptase domain-containing protein n=1 Tax=Paspalum notatum var. saurae TaxID=547442 RepID=A0AAQ3TSZ4_PASNO
MADKSNSRVNRRVMLRFRQFLDGLCLSELHLNGRLFTWSNERDHSTLERIDRAFVSTNWLDMFPDHWLRALSSDSSDHSPVLLQLCVVPGSRRQFRFESVWAKFPGFHDVVKDAWEITCPGTDPCRLLDIKLRNTAKALKDWSCRFVGSVRLQLALAREIVLLFDAAQETRSLSPEELLLRRQQKLKCLGLASLSRTIARQRSRLLFLEAGDANTKFFHLQACHRSRRNFIQKIRVHGSEIVLEDAKADAFYHFFQNMFGLPGARSHALRFQNLGLNTTDLEGLDHCFTEEEVWAVVRDLPNEKAPGPDGFTGLFFKSVWSIVKDDILRVLNAFWSLDTRSLFLLNDAYIILLRKKADAIELKDFRPISLIHSISKLLTKVLSVRLAPKLKDLISCNQSAFIKTRSIHYNFHAIQLTCKLLHRKRVPAVLLKVDLARAFDSIASLLASSSTKVLLNGRPGRRICHARGLRQGDPLSPMLFVVIMEALNGLIKLAYRGGFLASFRHPAVRCRALLYAEDLVIFVTPLQRDLRLLKRLLDVFAGASGLCTNLSKCSATPIACSLEDLMLQQTLGCQVVYFPCIYLGVLLHIKKLRKNNEQVIIDKVAAQIPKWKGSMLNLAGRAVLVKATLSAILVHVAITTCLSNWAVGAIDKLRRSFLWSGEAVTVAGRCKVAWPRVCRPVEFGGLGISNTDQSRGWISLAGCDVKIVQDLFRASVEITLGDGSTALFWVDYWLQGMSIEMLGPNLIRAVPPRFRSRTVWEKVHEVSLREGVPDNFRWHWTSDGMYSSASAYRACFLGSTFFLGAKFLWKAKVHPKVKFFAWLAAKDRCWTAERRRRQGLQDNDACALCDQESESIDHLLVQCSFARQVWFLVLRALSWHLLVPESNDTLMVWWSVSRKKTDRELRPGSSSSSCLLCPRPHPCRQCVPSLPLPVRAPNAAGMPAPAMLFPRPPPPLPPADPPLVRSSPVRTPIAAGMPALAAPRPGPHRRASPPIRAPPPSSCSRPTLDFTHPAARSNCNGDKSLDTAAGGSTGGSGEGDVVIGAIGGSSGMPGEVAGAAAIVGGRQRGRERMPAGWRGEDASAEEKR